MTATENRAQEQAQVQLASIGAMIRRLDHCQECDGEAGSDCVLDNQDICDGLGLARDCCDVTAEEYEQYHDEGEARRDIMGTLASTVLRELEHVQAAGVPRMSDEELRTLQAAGYMPQDSALGESITLAIEVLTTLLRGELWPRYRELPEQGTHSIDPAIRRVTLLICATNCLASAASTGDMWDNTHKRRVWSPRGRLRAYEDAYKRWLSYVNWDFNRDF